MKRLFTGLLAALLAFGALAQVSSNPGVTQPPPTSIPGWTFGSSTGTGSVVLSVAPTITGHPTIEGVTSTGATGTGKFVFDTNPSITGTNQIMQVGGTDGTNGAYVLFQDTGNSTSRGFIGWGGTTGGTTISDFVVRSQGDLVFYENGSQRMRLANTLTTLNLPLLVGTGSTANQVRLTQSTVPTCTTNCGTGSPTVVGTDTAGIITLGTTPASAFQVNFNGTWAAVPSCIVQSALATMVVGKQPIAVVATTTTMTVTTNGTAPSTSDKYSYICMGVS